MNTFLNLTLAFALGLFSAGCAVEFGPLHVRPISVPPNCIVTGSGRTYGVQVGQNTVTQSPEVKIGITSITFSIIPTGTNVTAPAFESGFNLDQSGFSTGIEEHVSTK